MNLKIMPLIKEMKNKKYHKYYILLAFLSFVIFVFFKNDTVPDVDHQQQFNDDYAIHALEIPDELTFAGEKVPTDLIDVREGLDMELLVNTYWQSHTLLLIKRSNRYFPIIEPILEEYGIPEDFKFLPVIESDLMNVVSPSGATGLWQFLQGTAKDYGLEIRRDVDERYHLEKATRAACRFLKDSYEKYEDWTLVAASYNAGRRRISESLEKQHVDNYYDLYLNAETARYVYRIIALKLILSEPEKYGFHLKKQDLYPLISTKDIEINNTIKDLAVFAKKKGINYKVLKNLNPWLRSTGLTIINEKSYIIKIPKKGGRSFKGTSNNYYN
jgi:membrane-bound lytic murein transglycosylase D